MTDIETETTDATEATAETETKEIDWKAEARKHEQRAKDNAAKAKANEAAAQRLAELEAANQTEAERVAAKLADAEKRAAELEAKALRAEVANEKGVPAALLTGSTSEELEASADALIAFRAEQATTKPPRPDLNQGKTGGSAASLGEQFGAFFTNQTGG